jgi:hypothetical protein
MKILYELLPYVELWLLANLIFLIVYLVVMNYRDIINYLDWYKLIKWMLYMPLVIPIAAIDGAIKMVYTLIIIAKNEIFKQTNE